MAWFKIQGGILGKGVIREIGVDRVVKRKVREAGIIVEKKIRRIVKGNLEFRIFERK